MAITFLDEKKRSKRLILILVAFVLILVFFLWFFLLRAPIPGLEVVPEHPRQEILKIPDINFEALRSPVLRQLKRFDFELISPLGEVLIIGNSYTIRWETYPYDLEKSIRIYLIGRDYQALITETQNIGFYEWYVRYVYVNGVEVEAKKFIPPGRYKIKLIASENNRLLIDKSDDYFSIVKPDIKPPTLWAWNYCISERPCGIREGNCEIDTDCLPGLFCAHNVGADYGQDYYINVCRKRPEEFIDLIFPDEIGIGRENPFLPLEPEVLEEELGNEIENEIEVE